MKHWFDGLAMLHRLGVAGGERLLAIGSCR